MSRRQAVDENGSVEYACIKSCVGNVVHTLIDTSQYTGEHLPGFVPVLTLIQPRVTPSIVRGIDHVAFAISHNEALSTIQWYKTVLGMKRFVTNR